MPSSSLLTDDTVTNTEYINQKKITQLNAYQEKKYAAYLDILRYFTIYCVILLVLAILRKRMILSYGFVNLLTMLLVIGGGIHLYLKIANINNRNNMNFDEYDWSFNPDNQSDPNRLDTNLHEEATTSGSTCIGELCCDTNVTKWCEPTGLCILKDSVCVDETSNVINDTGNDAVNGDSNSAGGVSHWGNYTCVFQSKTKCKNSTYPYYCPGDNTCYSTTDSENCPSDGVKCGVNEVWCPSEGVCKLATISCATTPCDQETTNIQSQCNAGEVLCTSGININHCVTNINHCGVDVNTEEKCGLKTGDEHVSCTFNNNHHQGGHVSAFISGIADSFSYFKKSMNNIPQKEEQSNIGSYSDPYSSYASV